ncbi:tetratricopeptide repeat protein [Leptospira alexanderi]|uniref:Tetratricopeptide repeat protein n=1 Tax=Leptospira alexanderi serovar Manhao 3 str. L 60 TaxID=1049759 RepID=V6HYP3_9LEPT|nr:tetratricopeptide repeat protein [Leptospira alexanderi]EQA62631.1 tetratricopeptide repeat protein [Leptospira alexanderi serovar Manhao 3 str. L 60]
MVNRVLRYFLMIGILICILSIFFSNFQDTDKNDPIAQPSRIQEILSEILSAIREIKTSMESSESSNPNATVSATNNGEDPNEIFNRAYRTNEKGDYLKAIKEYSKYLELVPGDASGYYNRGLAKYTLKQYGEAVKDFEKAAEIDPNKASVFLYKGYGNEMLDNCAQAVDDFQKAIELGEKNNPELYGHKARCENHDENYDEGFKDARKAVNLDKRNVYAFFELAYAQYGLGRYSDSVASYTMVLRLNPKDEVAFHNRGLAYVFLKKIPLACKDFRKSLGLGYTSAKDRLAEYCK